MLAAAASHARGEVRDFSLGMPEAWLRAIESGSVAAALHIRYFLDTQLYSYRANGTIARADWESALRGREVWLSPVTAYELIEGLLQASPHTAGVSRGAVEETAGAECAPRVRGWIDGALRGAVPEDFTRFRRSVAAGRRRFLARIHEYAAGATSHWQRMREPLFDPAWRRGRTRAADNLEAAFVFHTAILERTLRIRYNPDRHPSDYLDYLQLRYLADPELVFMTADRKLVSMLGRSLELDRIVEWESAGQLCSRTR